MAIKKPQTQQLEDNSKIVKRSGGKEKTVKDGVYPDSAVKRKDIEGNKSVGVSFGFTVNLENYESLRVDCWLNDTIAEGETQEGAFDRISKIVRKQVQKEINTYLREVENR